MPQKGQKTITMSKSFLDNLDLDNISEVNQRSVASLISLCVQKEFGDKSQKEIAKKILENLVR